MVTIPDSSTIGIILIGFAIVCLVAIIARTIIFRKDGDLMTAIRDTCKHDWDVGKDSNFGHRTCKKCGKHEMLYMSKIPNTHWE